MNIMRTKASWKDRRKARGLKPLFDAGFDPNQERDEKGRWTDGLGYREDQRSDATFERMRNEAKKYDEKGLRGDSTATMGYRTPITIPVSLVANVPGRNDEKRVPGDWQYDTLLEDVNKRGFTDETPIMVFINNEGKPYINEGNTRVAIAKLKGVERISAWIDWKNGSHQLPGDWSPDKIVPLAKRKITKDYSPDQKRDARGRWTEEGDAIVYHGTAEMFLHSIMKKGLLTKPKHRTFDPHHYRAGTPRNKSVYISRTLSEAMEWAQHAQNSIYDEISRRPGINGWPGRAKEAWAGLQHMTHPVVLEIHIPKERVAEFIPDKKVKNGTAQLFPDNIPPEWIKNAFTSDQEKAWGFNTRDWKKTHLNDGEGAEIYYAVVMIDGKQNATDAGFDPNQERDERGRWSREGIGYKEHNVDPFMLKVARTWVRSDKGEGLVRSEMTAEIGKTTPILLPTTLLAKAKKSVEHLDNPDGVVHVMVNERGDGYVYANAARVAAAKKEGIMLLPARVTWTNHAESDPGPWNADKVVDQAVFKDTPEAVVGSQPEAETYQQWTDRVESNPAFKEWFKGSKVVDGTGKPMVVYHGTPVWDKPHNGKINGDIEEFNRLASTEIIGREEGMDTIGSWFSSRPDKKGAAMYAGKDGAIYPVYLSIKNPWKPSSFDEFLDQMHIAAGRNPKKQNPRGLGSTTELREKLIKEGYDGMVFPLGMEVDGNEQEMWIAFHPEQIKSAIGNKGTFNPKSKKITDANPDPSGTEPLQKTFKKDMKRRWQDVRIAIAEGLKTYDFTGVGDRVVPFQNWIDQVMASRVLGSGVWMKAYLKQAADLAEKRARGLVLDYDPDQPRDKDGKWTKTPGGDYVAFHGTMSRYLESIQKEGLVIKNKNDRNFQKEFYEGERGESIYVTDHLGRANEFASMLYDADPDRRMEYFGEKIANPAVPVIIEAHIPAAEAAKLKEDQFVDNGYMFPNKIPPEWIKAYYTPDVPSMVMKKWERHHLRDGAGDKILYFVILPKALTMDYDPSQPRDDHGRWTDNENFKKWFGNSKVLTKSGKPRVLYHQTPKSFDSFAFKDPTDIMSMGEGSGWGLWFADNPEGIPAKHNTSSRTEQYREGTNIMPVYVRMENPLYINMDNVEETKAIKEKYKVSGEFPWLISRAERQAINRIAGYDGVIVTGKNMHTEYVAFHPEQVKSAIGNKGTFDPKSRKLNDADIDWMKTLQDHAVTELQGIIEAVSQQASRAMANGVLARKNPTSEILKVFTKIGEARSNMLISYSVMKTFSVATLEAYRNMGVDTVGIIPEKVPHVHVGDAARKTKQPRGKGGKFRKFTKPLSRANQRKAEKQHIMLQEIGRVNVLTAEDDRVCNTCEAIADAGPYSINKAMTLIPAHINCRCVFIPTRRLPLLDFDPDQPRDERGRWTDFKFKPTGTMGKPEPAFGPPLSAEEKDVLVNQELMRSEVPKGAGIKGFLEVMAGMAGSRPSVAKLLLEHGREYKADANTFAGPRGEPQMCYMNSGKAAIDDPELTYVEGYVSVSGVPIAHAWLLDGDGNVVDPTIRTDLKVEDYFGIPFKTNYMMLSIMKNKYWGLLGDHSTKTLRPLLEGREKSFVRDGEFDMIMNPLSAEDEKWVMSKLVLKDYDPDQPRAPKGSENGGQWISQEGAPDSIGGGEVPKYHQPDQRVFEVGGDTWNKKMATQLELEYVAAKPALEEIEKNAVGQTVNGVFSAEDWNTVNPITQKKIENSWKIVALGDTYKQEVEAYWESEAAQEDVAYHVLSSFQDGDSGFFEDVMEALRDGDEPSTFPFSDDILEQSLILELKDNTKLTVGFKDNILNDLGGHIVDPNQMNLPGVEPQKPADFLTKEMRLELSTMIKAKFNENVEEVFKTQSMDVPSWLNDSTAEIVDQAWEDLSDQEKYSIASQGNALSNENDGPRDKVVNDIPAKYDPTQAEPDSQNYRDTQVMARYMSIKRAQDLIKERLGKDESTENIADWDNELWEAWKASSTSAFGILLQLAIADEFQGRYRIDHLKDKIRTKDNETHEDAIRASARVFGENGYEKVKALVRAKWETTQWMLDKADMPKLNLYRGLTIDPKDIAASQQIDVALDRGNYAKLPGVRVQRNGAASTSHSVAVANDWKLADANKITLRAVVPRTAIISVPAYGVNVHKERESVIMGTAWVGWDAWHGTAPDLDTYPLQEMIP